MQKVKSNALWNELSDEQRATLDQWLFDERLSYIAAWPRAQKELGFKGSKASLHRYFVRREKERVMTEFKSLRDEVAAIRSAPEDAESLRAASMKVLGQFLFQQVRRAPDKVKEWAPVADLMVRNDYNEIVRAGKAKEHQIRRDAMEFAKERHQFDVMEQALKALPQLKELAEAKKDPRTERYEENAHWNRVRRQMFGFIDSVQPESAEEEAEMLAAKKEREARAERKVEIEQEKILDVQPLVPSSLYYAEYLQELARREVERWEMCGEYEI
jgi:hypothetical protein